MANYNCFMWYLWAMVETTLKSCICCVWMLSIITHMHARIRLCLCKLIPYKKSVFGLCPSVLLRLTFKTFVQIELCLPKGSCLQVIKLPQSFLKAGSCIEGQEKPLKKLTVKMTCLWRKGWPNAYSLSENTNPWKTSFIVLKIQSCKNPFLVFGLDVERMLPFHR